MHFAITNHQGDVLQKNKRASVRAWRRQIKQNATEITDSGTSDSFVMLIYAFSSQWFRVLPVAGPGMVNQFFGG